MKQKAFFIFFKGLSVAKTYLRPSSSKCRVTVDGELMFLESYGNCDVTNTVTLPPFVTFQNNFSLRFVINTVTLLLLIFRRVSR